MPPELVVAVWLVRKCLVRKFLLITAVLIGLLPASMAKAHDPIILTSDQRTPAEGPLILDGTISFALYGSLETSGETRGFRVNFKKGDPLYFSILIPDLAPENALDDKLLPYLEVIDPSGAKSKLATTTKISFAEPFTGTSYVRLTELTSTAVGGTYSVTIKGDAPARFTVSVGQTEMFGSPVENINNRDLGVAGVMTWYGTGQASEPSAVTSAPSLAPSSTATSTVVAESDSSRVTILIAIAAIFVLGSVIKVLKTRRGSK